MSEAHTWIAAYVRLVKRLFLFEIRLKSRIPLFSLNFVIFVFNDHSF